jgi:hypothetical protein
MPDDVVTGRESILAEVVAERHAQEAQGYTAAWDAAHTPDRWLCLLLRHAGLGVDDGDGHDPARYRRQLVRVAALAVAALEAHDRKDAPPAVPPPRFGHMVPADAPVRMPAMRPSPDDPLARLRAEAGRLAREQGKAFVVVAPHRGPLGDSSTCHSIIALEDAEAHDLEHEVFRAGPG